MTQTMRSATAQAGFCDEQMLVRDVLAQLVDCETVTDCVHIWMRYVASVEDSISPETVDQLGRALRIRIAVISPEL